MRTGIVLGPAGQDLHDPLDLLVAADDRVELGLPGELGEVAAELVEHHGPLGGLLAGLALALARVAGQELDDLLADTVEVSAELLEDLGGHALALPDQAEQDVLGADVVVAELQRLAERQLEDLLGPGREGDVAGRGGLSLADDLLDLGADGLERDAQGLERLGGDPLPLVDQPEQDVLRPDVVVVQHPRLFLGEDHHPPGTVRESLKHPRTSGPLSRATSGQRPPGSRDHVLHGGRRRHPRWRLVRRERLRAAVYPGGVLTESARLAASPGPVGPSSRSRPCQPSGFGGHRRESRPRLPFKRLFGRSWAEDYP